MTAAVKRCRQDEEHDYDSDLKQQCCFQQGLTGILLALRKRSIDGVCGAVAVECLDYCRDEGECGDDAARMDG